MAFEAILVSGTTEIVKRLAFVVADQIGRAWNVKDDLKELEKTLRMIEVVTDCADKWQVDNVLKRCWLRSLKDEAYTIDDILDEFSYEEMRRHHQHTIYHKVRSLFFVSSSANKLVFPLEMAKKIKESNRRLNIISDDRVRYQLQRESDPENMEKRNRSSAAIVDESVIGRDNDRSEIVDMMFINRSLSTSDICSQNEKNSVIAIVGMGGVGKTKLAQLVFDDDAVKKHFHLRIWVSLTDDFNDKMVLTRILESVTENRVDVSIFEVLVRQVDRILKDKKYFLVLDGLWDEDADKWDRLKRYLSVGAQGSTILVTTRKKKVALNLRGTHYQLKPLSDDQCWFIIKQRAKFPTELETSELGKLGKEIASKCGGLPQVANTLGHKLYGSRLDITRWKLILKKVDLKVLKLSYDDLPSIVRLCFTCCSIFPKGRKIFRENLIQIWMSEGILQLSDDEESTADEYFNDLLQNSLLQDEQVDKFGEIKKCKMHILVHDLAQIVAGSRECSIVEVSKMKHVVGVRRLQLVFDKETSEIPEALCNSDILRTIVVVQAWNCKKIQNIFSNKCLRVLEMRGSLIEELPSSIAKLKHIRYLDLSESEGVVLHDESPITSLYNLQTLILRKCSSLCTLPKRIGCCLKNLRHIDLSYTGIKVLPKSVTSLCNLRKLNLSHSSNFEELPSDIGALTELRCLDISNTKIKELPDSITHLHNLRRLKFTSCPNLQVLPQKVGEFYRLRDIDFSSRCIQMLP